MATGARRDFCTYFDHRYLPYGLALHRSLRKHCPDFRLFVLCLDEACEDLLRRLALPGVVTVGMKELERADPELAASRSTRSLVEYYFTCTASLCAHLLAQHSDIETVTYLDSDLGFFANPQPVFDELGQDSVLIIEHRPPPRLQWLNAHGRFNVGWVSFRRTADGLRCLQDWRTQCIAWCYDKVDGLKFGDQGYLTEWPTRFTGIRIAQPIGFNVAPWNVEQYRIHGSPLAPRVDGEPLIFYHFHGLKRIAPHVYDAGLRKFDLPLSRALRETIYVPYVQMLMDGVAAVASVMSERERALLSFSPKLTRSSEATPVGRSLEVLRGKARLARGIGRGDYLVEWRGNILSTGMVMDLVRGAGNGRPR